VVVQRATFPKRDEFERAGIPESPTVDARPGGRLCRSLRSDEAGRYQEVEPDEQGCYHSEVLPGFWIDPTWFWQDPLPNVERVMMQVAPEAYRRYLMGFLGEKPG
jgi:hypothetical protein